MKAIWQKLLRIAYALVGKRPIWQKLLQEAYRLAEGSPDPSTHNAALLVDERGIVLSSGINEFPQGVDYTEERWERPLKYQVIEHAERNSIFAAAKAGIAVDGLTMVCPWAACADCARAIIQAGVRRLVTHKDAYDRSPERWKESIAIAFTMLEEAGIEVVFCTGKIGDVSHLHSGERWDP